MTVNWPRVKVSQLCEIIVDCVNKTAPKAMYETPYKMIRTTNIKNGVIDLSACTYVNQEAYEKWTRRAKVNMGDVLLTREAPMGEVGLVTFQDTVFLGQRIMQYRVNPQKIDSNFLFYAFLSPDLQYQFRQHNNTGSTVSHIKVPDCSKFEINVPTLIEQKKIAKVMRDLDQKIALNNKINAELESMAKLIYDYWFVQFDFPDKNGKPYKSSGGKMVYNEALKREIPEGWRTGSLLDIANFTNGIACQKYKPNAKDGTYKVIKIREMSNGFTDKTELVSKDIPKRVVINNGDVLFSWSATLDVKMWAGGIGALNQHIFKVTSDVYPRTFYYFEVLRYLNYFKMIAELRKTTMGHITQDHLKQSMIVIPPGELIEKLHSIIDPTNIKILGMKEQNMVLVKLRDWLLPMLMNGQVTVGNGS
jgi:type I restriction enzyme S subunit